MSEEEASSYFHFPFRQKILSHQWQDFVDDNPRTFKKKREKLIFDFGNVKSPKLVKDFKNELPLQLKAKIEGQKLVINYKESITYLGLDPLEKYH